VRVADRSFARGEAVSREMLDAIGVPIPQGDIILIRSGWLETKLASPDYYDGAPGIDVGAARWLADRGVAAVGADNFAIEPIPFPPEQAFPVHRCLIRDFGVAPIEGLVFDQLAQRQVSAFLCVAAPLPMRGPTGKPAGAARRCVSARHGETRCWIVRLGASAGDGDRQCFVR
jgi:kynurenine formamidase